MVPIAKTTNLSADSDRAWTLKNFEFYYFGSANINGQANDVTVSRHADI